MHDHDLTVGGTVTYVLTGSTGDAFPGWWRITAADPPTSLEFVDGYTRAVNQIDALLTS